MNSNRYRIKKRPYLHYIIVISLFGANTYFHSSLSQHTKTYFEKIHIPFPPPQPLLSNVGQTPGRFCVIFGTPPDVPPDDFLSLLVPPRTYPRTLSCHFWYPPGRTPGRFPVTFGTPPDVPPDAFLSTLVPPRTYPRTLIFGTPRALQNRFGTPILVPLTPSNPSLVPLFWYP